MEKSESVKPFRVTYSATTKDGIGALVTFSYDTQKELEDGMQKAENWMALSEMTGKQVQPSKPAYTQRQQQPQSTENLGNCGKCGSPNKISKQGKVYCSNTCWLKKEY